MKTIYNKQCIMAPNFPVEAFDVEHKSIGQFDSIFRAAKELKISYKSVWRYLFIKSPRLRTTGVSSKKHPNKYHFKLKQE